MLNINPEKICYIIIKAREFDEKVEPSDPDSGSNPIDDKGVDILEDSDDDPTYEELISAIEILNEDEQIELLALAWLGRGDFESDEWGSAIDQARSVRDKHVPEYLVGIPLLGDYLEEGLSCHGYTGEEVKLAHL